ncbi:hypothetical protein EOM27_03505, partial [Candidatus Saccharibacteria bacterium]|nr:hypothetical protein [Candidatus Saccharibacteria bacterium]
MKKKMCSLLLLVTLLFGLVAPVGFTAVAAEEPDYSGLDPDWEYVYGNFEDLGFEVSAIHDLINQVQEARSNRHLYTPESWGPIFETDGPEEGAWNIADNSVLAAIESMDNSVWTSLEEATNLFERQINRLTISVLRPLVLIPTDPVDPV